MADKSAHKAKTRARILDEAAMAMRARGSDGIGVSELMKRAGLTHGGFYAHFESRDDLVAHAVDRMFQDSAAMVARYLGAPDGPALAALIDFYLSEAVMRAADRGCPLPALTGEAARMPEAARARFERGVAGFRDAIARALVAMGREDAEALAASVLAEMVGAMALARSFSDGATGAAMLAATRKGLKARLGLA